MRPFFIVGCDRSGTTMLRLILDRSDDVAIPTESMFIADMAAIRPRFGDLSNDEQFDRLAKTVWRHPKVREWRLGGSPPPRAGRSRDATARTIGNTNGVSKQLYAAARAAARTTPNAPKCSPSARLNPA